MFKLTCPAEHYLCIHEHEFREGKEWKFVKEIFLKKQDLLANMRPLLKLKLEPGDYRMYADHCEPLLSMIWEEKQRQRVLKL